MAQKSGGSWFWLLVGLLLGVALTLDPKTEKFVNNSQADAMLTREYRAPFVVPAAGQV